MKALLIEFDGGTGIRAGNIVIDDKLKCYGWQQLATTPCLEIRVIEDNRDITQYEGIPGITVLHNDAEIEAAIAANMPPAYRIADEVLFKTHLEQKKINLDNVLGKDTNEVLKNLYAQGIKGIAEIKRPTLVEVYGPPEKRAAKGLPA